MKIILLAALLITMVEVHADDFSIKQCQYGPLSQARDAEIQLWDIEISKHQMLNSGYFKTKQDYDTWVRGFADHEKSLLAIFNARMKKASECK